jgi:CheY-like chemotaxis protein
MAETGNSTRVLIADDQHIIADTLALILKQCGFETKAVYSGEDAVEEAETMMPNVLISDVIMGGMNGIESAMAIRLKFPDCRIILISGQAATSDLLGDTKPEGRAFELLTKPVHPMAIFERLAAPGILMMGSPRNQAHGQRLN